MRALLIPEKGAAPVLSDDLDDQTILGAEAPGAADTDAVIDVDWSSLNFKDGMALSGRGIVRSWPLVPGIDAVGTVRDPGATGLSVGDTVVLNGAGAGESRHGGYAEATRVPAEAAVRVPEAFTAKHAAAIGTAGFTAMLCVLALEDAGMVPEHGPILVTGAAGGVGSVAVSLLAGRGFQVTASTGRVDSEGDFLRSLGATEIIHRDELSDTSPTEKPLQSQRWAGAVDSVGSTTLGNALAQTRYGGAVACCGLAAGPDLPTTVLPFILRGVRLLGANSVDAPLALRQRAWDRLAEELDVAVLDSLTETIGLSEMIDAAERILAGGVRGRTVVDVSR